MREIKFRAWDKNIKVMRNWEYLQDIPQRAFWTAEDLEITQFTGLKDKNGKEIYEGDVVEAGHQHPRGRVEYSYDGFHITPHRKLTNDCEVIGNMYENPELLKL